MREPRREVAREAGLPERKLRAAAEVKKASPELVPLASARREIKRATIVEKLENVEARQAEELAGMAGR